MSDGETIYTKDNMYKKAIREVGIWADDDVAPDKVEWRRKAWARIGVGWFAERVDFTADGKKETIRFYYGSSEYDSKQMSRLIDCVVQDCKAVGVSVRPPEEIEALVKAWGVK